MPYACHNSRYQIFITCIHLLCYCYYLSVIFMVLLLFHISVGLVSKLLHYTLLQLINIEIFCGAVINILKLYFVN